MIILSNKKNVTSYEDFCHGVAVVWSFLIKYWIKLKALKEKSAKQVNICVKIFLIIINLLIPYLKVCYYSLLSIIT